MKEKEEKDYSTIGLIIVYGGIILVVSVVYFIL